MPGKKLSTKKNTKRDMMDFIEDACRTDSTVGVRFLEELNRSGATANDLYQLLINWGYTGVRYKDVTLMLKVLNNKLIVKNAMIETGY